MSKKISKKISKKTAVMGLCLVCFFMILLLPFSVYAKPKDQKTGTVKDKDDDSKGKDDEVFYTVTLDGNGKAGTLWTYKVPAGMSLNDAIEGSDDPVYLWSKYYREIDVDGKHYKAEQYSMPSSGDDSDEPPFIIFNRTNRFSLLQPITSDITIYALWEERIDRVELTITLPEIDTEIFTPAGDDFYLWIEQTNPPVILTPENADYAVDGDYDFSIPAFWIADESGEVPFYGLIESGKKYLLMVFLEPNSGYYLSKDTEISVTNGKLIQNCFDEDNSAILQTIRIPDPEKKEPVSEEKPEPDTEPASETGHEETESEVAVIPKVPDSPKEPGVVKEPGTVKTPGKTFEKEITTEKEIEDEAGIREKETTSEKKESADKIEAESEETVTEAETVTDESEETGETANDPAELKKRNYLPAVFAAAGGILILIGGGLVLILKIIKNRKA